MLKRYSRSTLAQNTLWMVLGQGLRLGISVLYFTVIARSLGTQNYGAFVAVVSLVAIVFPFGALGSGILLIKNVSRDQSLFGVYWCRGLLTTTVASSALLLVTVALARFILPTEIPFLLVLLVSASDLIGMSLIWIAGQAFQAFERLNWTAIIHVLISATRLIGALIVVQIHPHPTALQWGCFYSCSTATVVIASLALVTVKLGLPHFAWPRSKAELREGFYFSASLCAQTVYNDIDKTMLASLSTLEATGIYGAAYQDRRRNKQHARAGEALRRPPAATFPRRRNSVGSELTPKASRARGHGLSLAEVPASLPRSFRGLRIVCLRLPHGLRGRGGGGDAGAG